MSHNDTDTETGTIPIDGPFEDGESHAHIIDAGRSRNGRTALTDAGFAHRIVNSGNLDFSDPKPEGDVECPLGDHPAARETQDTPKDVADREEGGETS